MASFREDYYQQMWIIMGMSRRRVLLAKPWSTKEITTIYNALALSLFSDSSSLGAGDDKREIECIHLGYRFVALLATRTRRKGFSISSFKALNSPREWWQTVDRLHPVHLLRLPCQGKWSLGYLGQRTTCCNWTHFLLFQSESNVIYFLAFYWSLIPIKSITII